MFLKRQHVELVFATRSVSITELKRSPSGVFARYAEPGAKPAAKSAAKPRARRKA